MLILLVVVLIAATAATLLARVKDGEVTAHKVGTQLAKEGIAGGPDLVRVQRQQVVAGGLGLLLPGCHEEAAAILQEQRVLQAEKARGASHSDSAGHNRRQLERWSEWHQAAHN